MRGLKLAVAAAVVVSACVFVGLPTLMVMVVMGGDLEPASGCGSSDVALASSTSAGQLSGQQVANASTIVSVGYRLGVPRQAMVVALAVAHQESGFLNYANDGQGDDLSWFQQGIETSVSYPHEAVGSDHGSLGIFQQQWPWWGTMGDLMDPTKAAEKFYSALLATPRWQSMTVTRAGQAVQSSAYPDAYADDEPLARRLLDDAALAQDAAVTTASLTGTASCVATPVFPGTVAFPLPRGSGFTDLHNWGAHGARWSRGHTGTDLSVACGTPVLAATAGYVVVRTDQPWSGRWLVQVSTGVGRLTTWYGHMQSLDVVNGQQVAAGQRIGQVGDLGNASGCHLHFEVHPKGGAIYDDNVDPTRWLAADVGTTIGGVVPAADHGAGSVSFLTGNVPFTLSPTRAREQILYLLDQGPDVLLLQEVPARNISAIAGGAPGNWGVWQPKGRQGGAAIIWNADRFALDEHGAGFGFDGVRYDRWMPWAILRSGEGAFAVVAIHMPPDSSSRPEMRGYYLTMTRHYQELISELRDAGYPPIVGGDWNHPLDRTREPWSPVPMLRRVDMSTNWLEGRPCAGTRSARSPIDGFAFDPRSVAIAGQGCLARRNSDHRPVWVVTEDR